MITNRTVIDWCNLSSKRWHTYVLPRSYVLVSDTLAIIEFIVETILKFINNSRHKIFGYRVFKSERIGNLVWHLKTISSLQHFKLPLNACCNLVLVGKVPDGRTRSKRFLFTVGTFSLTRCILCRNFLKHLSIKFSG